MARRNLDMLPLLDVFMVVLFVFATIQEGELAAEDARNAASLRERRARERDFGRMVKSSMKIKNARKSGWEER